MSFKLKTQLKLDQKLSMTTQLQQSIQLLSLNHQEIKDKIQEELLENPVLQTEEDAFQKENAETPNEENSFEDSIKSLQDWAETSKGSSYRSSSQEKKNFEPMISEPVTLKSHLLWQAQISRLSNKDKSILVVLIFDLDERGYLTSSLEEIAQREKLSLDQLKFPLETLQNMDPLGVGARDIKECLMIQARHLEEDTKDMIYIIQDHLEDLKNKNYKNIGACLNISEEEVLDICKIIQSMQPIPAQNFSTQPTEYITPDIYIYKQGNDYKMSLNEDGFPDLRINKNYKKMLNASHPKSREDIKFYIKDKIQAGDWFIRSILQRRETIKKVVTSLIKYQKDFLEHGFLHLKPLILQDVAEDISVHISTVSRVASNKYAYTPQGLIPLKYFFNIGVLNQFGEAISIPVMKYHIKEWVGKEDIKRPLSDRDLANKLSENFKVSLSRRTVAQYRDSIGIPSVNKRKSAS